MRGGPDLSQPSCTTHRQGDQVLEGVQVSEGRGGGGGLQSHAQTRRWLQEAFSLWGLAAHGGVMHATRGEAVSPLSVSCAPSLHEVQPEAACPFHPPGTTPLTYQTGQPTTAHPTQPTSTLPPTTHLGGGLGQEGGGAALAHQQQAPEAHRGLGALVPGGELGLQAAGQRGGGRCII